MALLEKQGINHALWVWDPSWEPWTEEVDAFTLAFEHYNGSPQDYDPECSLGDNWIAMLACSRVLRQDRSFMRPLLERLAASGKIETREGAPHGS